MDQNVLYRFFEGLASVEEEKNVREWLEASSDNKAIFLKERRIFDAILLTDMDQHPRKKLCRSHFFYDFLKVAALITLIFGSCLFYYQYHTSKDKMLYQTLSVPAGQRINIILPDGTDVWLNSRTTIKYPVSFDQKERRVFLNGEAYFKVKRNVRKPFIVHTDKYDVAVLGTEFNVEAYSDQEEFKTTLMKGRVKVSSIKDKSDMVVLDPRQMAYMQKGKLHTALVEDFSIYRWKEGLICFKNAPFDEIMRTFEKYYDLSIRVENKQVKGQTYSGKFRQTDNMEDVLKVLKQDIDFSYEYDNQNHIIYIR